MLQVASTASLEDIRRSYRALSLHHHPDRNAAQERSQLAIMQRINEAWRILSDSDLRRLYDTQLTGGKRSCTLLGGPFFPAK